MPRGGSDPPPPFLTPPQSMQVGRGGGHLPGGGAAPPRRLQRRRPRVSPLHTRARAHTHTHTHTKLPNRLPSLALVYASTPRPTAPFSAAGGVVHYNFCCCGAAARLGAILGATATEEMFWEGDGGSAAAMGSMLLRVRLWPTASPGAPRSAPSPSREPPSRPAPPRRRRGLTKRVGAGRGGRLGRGAGTTPSGTRSRRGCGASGRSSAGGKTARTTAFRRARRGWTCEGSLPPPRAAPTLCLRPARAAYAPPGTSRAQAGPGCRRAVSVLTSSRDERRGARGPAFGCKPLGRG